MDPPRDLKRRRTTANDKAIMRSSKEVVTDVEQQRPNLTLVSFPPNVSIRKEAREHSKWVPKTKIEDCEENERLEVEATAIGGESAIDKDAHAAIGRETQADN
ncbi:hypothetical protein Ddye_019410 [Dipteronia dyeriana]|uniref:Uncharacterized protein n=1 Tax=Dipteronia dyeriana TaxID=168575 RepID=A0AAD9TYQ3_9ROSI|nr:hypothetical protein Ddye_019410 [Dipteronia dyeriana]